MEGFVEGFSAFSALTIEEIVEGFMTLQRGLFQEQPLSVSVGRSDVRGRLCLRFAFGWHPTFQMRQAIVVALGLASGMISDHDE